MSVLERKHKIEKIRQHCIKTAGTDRVWNHTHVDASGAPYTYEDPVRLSDVLVAFWDKGQTVLKDAVYLVWPGWDEKWELYLDDLEKQSDECIQFICNKLGL